MPLRILDASSSPTIEHFDPALPANQRIPSRRQALEALESLRVALTFSPLDFSEELFLLLTFIKSR